MDFYSVGAAARQGSASAARPCPALANQSFPYFHHIVAASTPSACSIGPDLVQVAVHQIINAMQPACL